MYLTIQSTKRRVGFGGIELNDLIIGIPLFFTLLLMFSFSSLRTISIILFVISAFMFTPVNLSKKNRMYKVIGLVFRYFKSDREFVYYKDNIREVSKNGIINRIKN